MTELHVFTDVDGIDTVTAKTPADATQVWESHTGEKLSDYFEGGDDKTWRQIPDDWDFTIWFWQDDHELIKIPEGARFETRPEDERRFFVTAKAAAWTKLHSQTFLCSTEV